MCVYLCVWVCTSKHVVLIDCRQNDGQINDASMYIPNTSVELSKLDAQLNSQSEVNKAGFHGASCIYASSQIGAAMLDSQLGRDLWRHARVKREVFRVGSAAVIWLVRARRKLSNITANYSKSIYCCTEIWLWVYQSYCCWHIVAE